MAENCINFGLLRLNGKTGKVSTGYISACHCQCHARLGLQLNTG